MNNELFLTELAKAMSVDGRVNVDAYSRVVRLIDDYTSINNSVNTPVSGSLPEPMINEVRNAARKSCKGHQHAMRYQPMLNQFFEGASWMFKRLGNDH